MAAHFAFEAIGTHWQIDIYEALSTKQEGVLLLRIRERIELFEATYSRFRPASLVSSIARAAGKYRLPDDALPMLTLYHELYEVTGGLFTPFMGRLLSDAGYDAAYSLTQQAPLAAPPSWDEAVKYRHPVLEVRQPFLFDFGAAGKGYLIDIVAALIESEGVRAFCIDAGGDILHRNAAPLRVGLEHPDDPAKVIGVIELRDRSLCGSSGNRRKWQHFHHIISPRDLSSPTHILALWVLADSTMLADALATCLFFVGPKSLTAYAFDYLLIRSDYSIECSTAFEDTMLG